MVSGPVDPDTISLRLLRPSPRRFIMAEEMSAATIFGHASVAPRTGRLPKLIVDFLVSTGRNETRVEITSPRRRKGAHPPSRRIS